MTLPDSGKREQFESGAVRDVREGKGRYDLITPHGLRRLAVHYQDGAEKYDDRNWEKGMPISRCFDSAVRHLYEWLAGDDDEDKLAAAVWNVFAIMHYEATMPELMDIPTRVKYHKPESTADEEFDRLLEQMKRRHDRG